MKNEQKLALLMSMHKDMLAKIERLDPKKLPKGVNVKKLEEAYEALKGYALVFKKIE